MSDVVRAHIYVSGRVQGVFFRVFTREQAGEHGVNGWARNLPDGRVEAVFEGPRAAVEQVVDWCRHGPPYAEVSTVEVDWETPEKLDGFSIS